MGFVIDTSVFIRAEREGRVLDPSRWPDRGTAFISAMTVSELLVGVHRANTESRRLRRQIFINDVLNSVVVLDIDTEIAKVHARLIADVLAQGTPVGTEDLFIAATALHFGFPIFTANPKDFEKVPGLEVIEFN